MVDIVAIDAGLCIAAKFADLPGGFRRRRRASVQGRQVAARSPSRADYLGKISLPAGLLCDPAPSTVPAWSHALLPALGNTFWKGSGFADVKPAGHCNVSAAAASTGTRVRSDPGRPSSRHVHMRGSTSWGECPGRARKAGAPQAVLDALRAIALGAVPR